MMLTRNKKMRKQSGLKTFNFTIPAFKSDTGKVTCPQAGECAKGCYAKQGAYNWSNVKQAHERNLQNTMASDFVLKMSHEIQKRRSIQRVRIHDSGDFYSLDYFKKWVEIARVNSTIQFYAYTKMVLMVKWHMKNVGLPSNFLILFSYGGKQDQSINPNTDRHCKVFSSLDTLIKEGYTNGSDDDNFAATRSVVKLGIVYHGFKSKDWGV